MGDPSRVEVDALEENTVNFSDVEKWDLHYILRGQIKEEHKDFHPAAWRQKGTTVLVQYCISQLV